MCPYNLILVSHRDFTCVAKGFWIWDCPPTSTFSVSLKVETMNETSDLLKLRTLALV